MPNGIEWAGGRARRRARRRRLVPLSTLLRPPELAAQLRTAASSTSWWSRRSAVATTSPTSRPSPRTSSPGPGSSSTRCPGSVRSPSGKPIGGSRPTTTSTGSSVDARGRGDPARRRPRDHLHLGQPGPPQGRDPHPRRRAAVPPRPGSTVRRLGATTASTSRCRSSGWAASAPACCRRWSPAPRCSPRRCPNRRARWRSSNGSGSRCSGVGPTRRRRWRGDPRLRRRRSRLAAPGQPRRRPPGRAPRAGRARGRTCSA